jgi:hypothetical protein
MLFSSYVTRRILIVRLIFIVFFSLLPLTISDTSHTEYTLKFIHPAQTPREPHSISQSIIDWSMKDGRVVMVILCLFHISMNNDIRRILL